jgi:2TM domain
MAGVVPTATMVRKGGATMLTAEEYRQAEFGYSLAEMRRGFKIHASVYAVVITGLIVLNSLLIAYTDADFPWVVFPLVGWGAGLTLHYFFGYRRAGEEIHYRQRKVEEYADKTRELV